MSQSLWMPKVGDLVEHFLEKRAGNTDLGVVIDIVPRDYATRLSRYVVYWTKSKYTDQCESYELELVTDER
tara:strand:- start:453 stop:665 length:213 start_codon:yes stop_codon:yes gene_type:complete